MDEGEVEGRGVVHLTLPPQQGGREMSATGRVAAQHTEVSPEEGPPSGMLKCILFVSAMVVLELIEHFLLQCTAGVELIFFTGTS